MAEKWNAQTAIVAEDLATGDKLPVSDESQTAGSKDRTITVDEMRKGIGGVLGAVQDKTGAYTLVSGDVNDIFLLDASGGNFTVTLPDAMPTGYKALLIDDGASGTITIAASTTLNSTKTTMTTQHEACLVVHVGSNVWHAMFLT